MSRSVPQYLFLACAFMLLAAARAPEARTLSYRVTPVADAGTSSLEVELRFRGDADGETMVELPSRWAGSAELWRHVRDLRIAGAERISGEFSKPVLHHKPGAPLRLRYRLVSAYESDPGFSYEKARPLIRPDWFFVHGESLFAWPAGRWAGRARFRWGKPPSGWRVASDLDHIEGTRSTVANIVNSVAIGGSRLRVVERDIGGAGLRVALLGRWSFPDDALAEIVASVVEAENAFWGDRPTPFLVAMAPLGDVRSGLSSTGTGRTDAFSIASTGGFELDPAVRFLAHEYMHSWVPIELGAMPEENEAVDYWFSEGFNDYLASKVLLRSGLWTLSEWAADKNETLLRYGTSSARNATADEVAGNFWTDVAVQQVSYDRGHLLAMKLDGEIAERSQASLDDVLRAQRKAAKGSPELASALFRKALLEVGKIDVQPDLDRYAARGETLLLPADALGDCARVVTERRRTFHRGYDADATLAAGGIIAGVVPDGPAHAAGMRDGMRLLGRESGKIGDSSVEIAYRVADESGERLIRYLPEGKAEVEVQRIELTVADADQEERCKARLAGKDP
jgi:predicted metalloprotease with PDZ domain